MRTSKLEAVDSSGDERFIQNMFCCLGRNLGHCMPGEEWYFNKTHLPVTCRMTKKGRHRQQEYHFRKSNTSYAISTILGPSGKEINETVSMFSWSLNFSWGGAGGRIGDSVVLSATEGNKTVMW